MKKIAITCGDPAGVGLEITEKWISENRSGLNNIVAIGPQHWTEKLKSEFDIETISVGSEKFQFEPGIPSIEGSEIAYEALEIASSGTVEGKFSSVVTNPINKSWMQKAGFKFPGHTEFFADAWGGDPTMAFIGDKLKIALVTWHIPLMDIKENLTADKIKLAVERASLLAKAYGISQPRIGVCGLNPHAGEEGVLGREELEIINPVLNNLRSEFPGVSNAQPGDTIFMRAIRREYDVVVALYHDQGLIPLKTMYFDTAVNVTLGLPYIRTSPDHGTGFEIVGKSIASHNSLANAITIAGKLSKFLDI